MERKITPAKNAKSREKRSEEPKRLSKLGEWMKAHPRGLEGKILDMRAVMK